MPQVAELVSLLVSFVYVRNRSAHTTKNRQPRSRTLLTYAGPSRADLESVLGPRPRQVLMFAPVVPYSSEVQQPGHTTAVLSGHPHTRWPAPFNHEQDRASSYGSEGWGFESLRARPGHRPLPIMGGALLLTRSLTAGP